MDAGPRRETAFGGYELLCVLATGGMASVHLARATRIGGFAKLLVIKRILPHVARDASFVRMFLDEARLAATLDHANVAHVFDAGSVDGDVYLAMEFLHGHDLRTIARAVDGPLPLAAAIAIVLGVCAGLHYAHERVGPNGLPLGLVHRDVSPSNVVVTYDGSVKVIDFGIAKAADRLGETRSGVLKGKPGYMSPEQCAGDVELDRRSDLFCVGILLYELTTGTRLFASRSGEFAQMKAIVEGRIVPPSEVARDYPAALEPIVLRALERDRDRRTPTAQSLQRELEAFAAAAHLDVATPRLAGFMAERFGAELAAWRAAERAGTSMADHIVSRGAPSKPAHDVGPPTETATAADRSERPTVAEPVGHSPGAKTPPRTRARRRLRAAVVLVAVAIAGATIAAIAMWPHPPAASTTPVAPVVPTAPAAAAAEAERAGKLELAVAYYVEALDAHPDAVTALRIAELDERLGRAAEATRYYARYLELAPAATDRDAIAARIAQLSPPPAVDAGVPVTTPPRPTVVAAHCRCMWHEDRPHWTSAPEVLCHDAMPELCTCSLSRGVPLCAVPFAPCEGAACNAHLRERAFRCSDPDYDRYDDHQPRNTSCSGYVLDGSDTGKHVDGFYTCTSCRTWVASQTSYAGAPGSDCTGYLFNGALRRGRLACE